MSQSHYGSFSIYSEIPPSLTTAGVWLGLSSVLCLAELSIHSQMSQHWGLRFLTLSFLRIFTAAHGGRKDPLPRQAARHTGAAQQKDKGGYFGLTKTNSYNSLMKASTSDYASSSLMSCTPCPESQALPSLLPCVWLSLSGVRCWVHSEGAP